jgi:hypothetical protein
MEKVQNPVILSVIHYRQNPLESTYLVGLAKAINPPHFALLVRVGQHTHSRLLARNAEYEIFSALLRYVLPELAQ